MIRTQIQLEEDQYQALKALSAQRQTSIAALIREALDEFLHTEITPAVPMSERRQRAIAAAGRFHSGLHDLAAQHDAYLAETYAGREA